MHIVQALAAIDLGGSQLVAAELAEFLVAKGHKVTVIAAEGSLGERIRRCGAEHLDWPIGKKRLSTLRYIKKMANWITEVQPDIIHVHSRLPAWICWQAIKRVPAAQRPEFLTTMHGHYTVSGYSAVMAKGSRVIAVSDHIHRYTQSNYPDKSSGKLVTIHGGASREDFPHGYRASDEWREKIESEFPELTGKRWLMLPGRGSRTKGHKAFVSLLERLAKDLPDVHGVFVGGFRSGSSYEKELKDNLATAGLQDRVTFTGDRLNIRDWMSSAEIVYNLSDRPEAFGRTVLEALRLGVPVIAWDHGGAVEIMNGIFPEARIPVNDMDALEARTRDFLDNPPAVADSDAFTLKESMNKHLAVYESLCEARKSAPGG